jgi:hypothetical protein
MLIRNCGLATIASLAFNNIEMDPHEDLVVAGMFGWVSSPALRMIEEYFQTVKEFPNPPAPKITISVWAATDNASGHANFSTGPTGPPN